MRRPILFALFLLVGWPLYGCDGAPEEEEREMVTIPMEPSEHEFDWPDELKEQLGMAEPAIVRSELEVGTNLLCAEAPWFTFITREWVTQTVKLGGRSVDDPPAPIEIPIGCLQRTYRCSAGDLRLVDEEFFPIGARGAAECFKGVP